MVVRADSPIKDLRDFMETAKQRKLIINISAPGNIPQLGGMLLEKQFNVHFSYVVAKSGGMQITQLEDSWQMATRAEYYENLIRVAATPKKQILTDVVLETLSIIAYKQPITKLEIEKIRGVKSDHAVNKLIEYNLVYEVGRLDVPGRPALFATTEEFLRRFGGGSTKELPEPAPGRIDEFRMEAEEELKFEGKLPEEAEKEMKY